MNYGSIPLLIYTFYTAASSSPPGSNFYIDEDENYYVDQNGNRYID